MIFDAALARARRLRAMPQYDEASFLHREIAERMAERLDDITHTFPVTLATNGRGGVSADVLKSRGGIETLIEADGAAGLLGPSGARTVLSLEMLPFANGALDCVFAANELHQINDLPGALVQIRRALRPDGLFLGALYGPETLNPLREAFLEAEAELGAPVSPHIAPTVDIRDAAGLLQRAGFALPVADAETITVSYASPFKLLQDLRAMAETNILQERSRRALRRAVFLRALQILQEKCAGPDDRLQIPFEIIFLTGWAPAATQQQPLRRGTGEVSFTNVFGKPGSDAES
jgi:SAM-dependent methyltransferase